jgi:hypothetical protein
MVYYDMEEISLKENYDERECIDIYISNDYKLGGYGSTGTQKEVYDALCEKNNDMTYLRDFVIFDGYRPFQTSCIGVDFLSIDITSDSPFDEEHPAGVSLGDIVTFSSSSLKPYIDSGYTFTRDNGSVYHSIRKHLNELSQEDLILLGQPPHIGILLFDSEPTLSKTHTFTVTMTADDGRVFSDSIEMTFE